MSPDIAAAPLAPRWPTWWPPHHPPPSLSLPPFHQARCPRAGGTRTHPGLRRGWRAPSVDLLARRCHLPAAFSALAGAAPGLECGTPAKPPGSGLRVTRLTGPRNRLVSSPPDSASSCLLPAGPAASRLKLLITRLLGLKHLPDVGREEAARCEEAELSPESLEVSAALRGAVPDTRVPLTR
ncbi:hypothetical protein R6Z07M_017837 [Ovis aries]